MEKAVCKQACTFSVQANSSPRRLSNLAAICASIHHTIINLTLTLTITLILNLAKTQNLTLTLIYLTNMHPYAQRDVSAYWITSRLPDQSAA